VKCNMPYLSACQFSQHAVVTFKLYKTMEYGRVLGSGKSFANWLFDSVSSMSAFTAKIEYSLPLHTLSSSMSRHHSRSPMPILRYDGLQLGSASVIGKQRAAGMPVPLLGSTSKRWYLSATIKKYSPGETSLLVCSRRCRGFSGLWLPCPKSTGFVCRSAVMPCIYRLSVDPLEFEGSDLTVHFMLKDAI